MRKNCFAYNQEKCKILRVRDCEDCSFFKTREELQLSRLEAIERIYSLDRSLQVYIDETYYRGQLFKRYKMLRKTLKDTKTA